MSEIAGYQKETVFAKIETDEDMNVIMILTTEQGERIEIPFSRLEWEDFIIELDERNGAYTGIQGTNVDIDIEVPGRKRNQHIRRSERRSIQRYGV